MGRECAAHAVCGAVHGAYTRRVCTVQSWRIQVRAARMQFAIGLHASLTTEPVFNAR